MKNLFVCRLLWSCFQTSVPCIPSSALTETQKPCFVVKIRKTMNLSIIWIFFYTPCDLVSSNYEEFTVWWKKNRMINFVLHMLHVINTWKWHNFVTQKMSKMLILKKRFLKLVKDFSISFLNWSILKYIR